MITSTSATGTQTKLTGTPDAALVNPNSALGKDDFLKLLTEQLKNQDPMNPTDDQSFIGTMAQFSALEQTTNMAGALDRLGVSQQAAQSIGLIGRTITGIDETSGKAVTGVVDSVTIADGSTLLGVGSSKVSPSTVTSVTTPPAAATPPTTSGTAGT